jgi:hypothetical protein
MRTMMPAQAHNQMVNNLQVEGGQDSDVQVIATPEGSKTHHEDIVGLWASYTGPRSGMISLLPDAAY